MIYDMRWCNSGMAEWRDNGFNGLCGGIMGWREDVMMGRMG